MPGVQTNFKAGSLGGGSSLKVARSVKDGEAPKATPVPRDTAPGAEPTSTASAVDTGSSQVPEGTWSEIEAWVGTDKGRAQQALDAENKSEKPRSTVVAKLQKLATPDETPAS